MRIEIQQLHKKYQDKLVLCIPELVIASGEFFGLVGNNGAGKTTLFRLILDLVPPTGGKVLSEGREVIKDDLWKAHTGSYLDEGFLINFLTPDEFFQFVGTTYGMSENEIHVALERLRPFFNGEILAQDNKYIRDFSKGNIQKIGIAAALLSSPQVLILDEPFANLDPTSQISLKRMMKVLNREKNTTILISSHNLNHVAEICTRIVLLENGKVIQDVRNNAQSAQLLAELETYFTVGS